MERLMVVMLLTALCYGCAAPQAERCDASNLRPVNADQKHEVADNE